MGAADFVNSEIQDLLKNGIIQKSISPYNNPIWVVDKKGVDESGNRIMRLVLDFRKLIERTIPDRYPYAKYLYDTWKLRQGQVLHNARLEVWLPPDYTGRARPRKNLLFRKWGEI